MPKARQDGFTLLEVLIALAILSMMGLATLRLGTLSATTAQVLEEKTLAGIVAENALVDALLPIQNVTRGEQTQKVSNMGRSWQVERVIAAGPDPRVQEVSIRVTGANAGASADISAFKVVDRRR